jgi:hypothetical protein
MCRLHLNQLASALITTPVRLTGSLTGSVVKFVHGLPELSARQLGGAVATVFSSNHAPTPDAQFDGVLSPQLFDEFQTKLAQPTFEQHDSAIKQFVASYLNDPNDDSFDGEAFRAAHRRITRALLDDVRWTWLHSDATLDRCVESHLSSLCYPL